MECTYLIIICILPFLLLFLFFLIYTHRQRYRQTDRQTHTGKDNDVSAFSRDLTVLPAHPAFIR